MEFKLQGEDFVLLQALLKATGLCDTGGDAKAAIINGEVTVDGEVEIRRGKKIRTGQIAVFKGQRIKVTS